VVLLVISRHAHIARRIASERLPSPLSLAEARAMATSPPPPGSAQFYRKRFESSVFGEHSMLPPPEVAARFASKESPSKYPSGQDTSFLNETEMPFRFTEASIEAAKANSPTKSPAKSPQKLLPNYQTTSAEVGKLSMESTDLPVRWYGRNGMFTSSWVAPSKTMTSSGLSTSIDRSDYHHTQDQGWSGDLGLKDYNIANLASASFVQS